MSNISSEYTTGSLWDTPFLSFCKNKFTISYFVIPFALFVPVRGISVSNPTPANALYKPC